MIINIKKPFVVEKMILIAVVNGEKYVFNQQLFRTFYGYRSFRLWQESEDRRVKRIFRTVNAPFPREYQVIRASGLGQRTSFIFWFPQSFDPRSWDGNVLAVTDFCPREAQKLPVIERAYEKVDKALRCVA